MKSKQSGLGMFNLLLILAVIVAVVVLALPHFMESHQGADKSAEGGLSSLYKAADKAVNKVEDTMANKEGEQASGNAASPEAPKVEIKPEPAPAPAPTAPVPAVPETSAPTPEASAPAPAAPSTTPAPEAPAATPAPADPATK